MVAVERSQHNIYPRICLHTAMASKQIYNTKRNRFRAKAYAKVFLPIESCEKLRIFSKGIIKSNYCKKGYISWFSLPKWPRR